MFSELISEQSGTLHAFRPEDATEASDGDDSEEVEDDAAETEDEDETGTEPSDDEAERRRLEALEAARIARERDEEERLFGFGPRRDD